VTGFLGLMVQATLASRQQIARRDARVRTLVELGRGVRRRDPLTLPYRGDFTLTAGDGSGRDASTGKGESIMKTDKRKASANPKSRLALVRDARSECGDGACGCGCGLPLTKEGICTCGCGHSDKH